MKRKRLVVLNTFKPLKKIIKFACNHYFTSISTENDSSSSFFSTSAFKCTSEVTCNKAARYNVLCEETFFFSLLRIRSYFTLVKTVRIWDLRYIGKHESYDGLTN